MMRTIDSIGCRHAAGFARSQSIGVCRVEVVGGACSSESIDAESSLPGRGPIVIIAEKRVIFGFS